MEEIAKLFNIELEEKFMIKDDDYHIYKLTKNGLQYELYNGKYRLNTDMLLKLLRGNVEMVKLPWKPRKGEKYYTPSPDFDHALCDYWDGFPSDFALKEAGMAFKTKKECEIAIPELRKKYLGIES
jgi:hypothetical protein